MLFRTTIDCPPRQRLLRPLRADREGAAADRATRRSSEESAASSRSRGAAAPSRSSRVMERGRCLSSATELAGGRSGRSRASLRIGHDRRRRLRPITPTRWPIGGSSGQRPPAHGLGHGLDRLGESCDRRRKERPLVVKMPRRRRARKMVVPRRRDVPGAQRDQVAEISLNKNVTRNRIQNKI